MRRLFLIIAFAYASDASFAQTLIQSDEDRLHRLHTISQTAKEEIPLVIAHRGASGYVPEHTTEAAAFAHALGSDYIEQDVVLSKDGIAVVLHDVTLQATTDVMTRFPGRSKDGKAYVWDFTWDELQTLTVHERYRDAGRGRFPSSTGRFRIATLEEHLQLIQGLNHSRGTQTGVYVEIKSPAQHQAQGLDPSKVVLAMLKDYGYSDATDRAFIQCFDEAEVLRLRTELRCRLPLIQLLSEMPDAAKVEAIATVADGIGVPLSAVIKQSDSDSSPVSTGLVDLAHRHALMVHAWTYRADDLPEFAASSEALLDLLVRDARVDGIFTDQPDDVLEWREAASKHVNLRGPFHLLRNKSTEQ